MEAIASELRAAGATVSTKVCDVRRWDEVAALARHAVDTHGGLDIWVNNAGIGYIMKPLLEVTAGRLDRGDRRQPDRRLLGPQGRRRDHGRTGSRRPHRQQSPARRRSPASPAPRPYTASKHGLVGLVRSAAIELGPHGITVNNVCPNHVTTGLGQWQNEYFAERQGKTVPQYLADMAARIPLGRPGLPTDTANAVAFLCSPGAAYITAESMNVSGGEEPH